MGTWMVSTLFRVPLATAANVADSDLLRRQAAIAAALRAVAAEPQTDVRIDLTVMQEQLDRVAARLDRLEDKVEMFGESDEAPLSWPSAVAATDQLEVPPLTTSRADSPAYDILLGPAVRRSTA
jgi:hypothetical protein